MDRKKKMYEKWTSEALVKRILTLEAALDPTEEGTATAAASPPEKKKPHRKLDSSKYSTRLVAFKLAYLGKRYGGFEFSAHANYPSIEEELWKAFAKAALIFPENPEVVNWDSIEYSKCGRTDKGVSAFGQVIVVRVRSSRPLPKKEAAQQGERGDVAEAAEEIPEFDDFADEIPYCRILNRILPSDIQMLAWCPTTPAEFSARHDCRERQYRYFFTQPAFAPIPQSIENPDAPKGTRLKAGWLDIEAMRKAAKKFEGRHDFRNFCKVDSTKGLINFERKVLESDIVEVKDAETALPFLDRDEFRPASVSDLGLQEKLPKIYYFHVRGSAFLWHQIRCMVAVVFLVGQGLEDPSIIDKLLDIEAEPAKPNYTLADEAPLVLWDCLFPRTEKPENAVKWEYVGEDSPLNQHGTKGLMNDMWGFWRERKIDEVLASQLLSVVASQADTSLRKNRTAPEYIPDTTRTFTGDNGERLVGRYQPLLTRPRGLTPAELFDNEAKRKGFANAAERNEAFVKKRMEIAAKRGKPPARVLDLEEGVE
ncbi:pseudouridine synthase [Jackrogersella minutella]|nr:pseudouridine synthase [Jackrogersella minutella]